METSKVNKKGKEDGKTEQHGEPDLDWVPDPQAVDNPKGFRINTWDYTVLGKRYQEARVGKRQRRQPGTIPDLAYLHWERTGKPPAGPYSALEIPMLNEIEQPERPDSDSYFYERPSSSEMKSRRLPLLADTLSTAFDENSLFPQYIRDFEKQMKHFHKESLATEQLQPKFARKTHHSLHNIGLQLGTQMSKGSTTPLLDHQKQKAMAGSRSKPNKKS